MERTATSQPAREESGEQDHAGVSLEGRASSCPGCQREASTQRCEHCGVALRAGTYRVLRVISEGPRGRMYEATAADGMRVALKELVFATVPDTAAITAFERESQLLRQLSHHGIPRFVAAFQEGSGVQLRLYLAQEFCEGRSLLEELKERRYSQAEALDVAEQVLVTLDYLHTRSPRVLHRDLKPANLIRRTDGSLALVDFGSARELTRDVTHGGTLVGTFGFMPPEQLGGTVDGTADLYALGATLLHLVTRKHPSELIAQGPLGDIGRHLRVGEPVRGFLQRLLATQRSERFQSPAQALEGLGILRTDERLGPSRAERRKIRIVAIVATVLLSVGLSLREVRRGSPPTPTAPVAAQAAKALKPATAPSPARNQPSPRPAQTPLLSSLGYIHQAHPMHQARRGAGGVRLPDGRILVLGGLGPGGPLSTAEIYSPRADRWKVVHPLDQPVLGAELVPLSSGAVLLVGGMAATVVGAGDIDGLGTPPMRFEPVLPAIFDPSSGRWRKTSLRTSMENKAVALPDGRVLVQTTSHLVLYDPKLDAFHDVEGPLLGTSATLTVLRNGQVLVVGGNPKAYGGPVGWGADLDDPRTGQQRRLEDHSREARLFDPKTETWTSLPPPNFPHAGHAASLLEDGRVLVAGDGDVNHPLASDAEIFDPLTSRWAAVAPMLWPRFRFELIPVDAEHAVAWGGNFSRGVPAVEVYDLMRNRWTGATVLPDNRLSQMVQKLGEGKIFLAGGFTRPMDSAEIVTLPGADTSAPAASGGARGAGHGKHALRTAAPGRRPPG